MPLLEDNKIDPLYHSGASHKVCFLKSFASNREQSAS